MYLIKQTDAATHPPVVQFSSGVAAIPHISPHCVMMHGTAGCPFCAVATFSSLRSTAMLAWLVTFPKTTCLLSRKSQRVHVMKNWHPLVFGAELAMDSTPGPDVAQREILVREPPAVN